jgi:acid phosphatase type 7
MIKRAGFFALTLLFVFLVTSFPGADPLHTGQIPLDELAGQPKAQEQWGKLVINTPNNLGNTFTSDPKTTRTITWQSTRSTGEVIIGGNHYTSTTTSRGDYYFHRVDVSGLKAGETYRYVAGSRDHYSPVYSFKTENSSGSFTVLHITDPQIGEGNNTDDAAVWKRVIEAARNKCPEAVFVVNTGDIVSNARETSIPFYFDYAQDTIAELAFVYSMGNNDSTGWYNRYFHTPDNGNGGFLYSFDYGNAHFINIDSNVTLTADQLNWLENDLKTNTRKWKVAMTHEGDYGRRGRNTALTRLFDQYNVDLVMIGHNHFYARSKPINTAGKEKPNGTVWAMPNAAGTKFNAKSNQNYLVKDEQPNLPMFSEIRFTETNIYLNSYTVDKTGTPKLFDTYTFR